MLDSRLEERVRKARAELPGSRIRVYTNGDFLTGRKLKDLVNAGVDHILVTLHGGVTSDYLAKFSSVFGDWLRGHLKVSV